MLKTQQREQIAPLTCDELILERLKDLKDGQRDLKDGQRDLNARIDKLENELCNVSRHSQIMTTSVVGIALAVVYFVFTH
ncbi:MAG: hypothetical protein IKP64_01995 [Selenomonadaceae bacterium]|nr:hypothetical protein [Selenomonadaceae bacterium]MBR4382308.1 hypothetical protein [Selenomonadaceae bacterium]